MSIPVKGTILSSSPCTLKESSKFLKRFLNSDVLPEEGLLRGYLTSVASAIEEGVTRHDLDRQRKEAYERKKFQSQESKGSTPKVEEIQAEPVVNGDKSHNSHSKRKNSDTSRKSSRRGIMANAGVNAGSLVDTDEAAPPAAREEIVNASDVVTMEDGTEKNKKRSREKNGQVEEEAEKSPKAAKTETAEVEGDAENAPPLGNAEDEMEDNGDGVEVVEGAIIGDDGTKTKKLKKRKIAMIIAYCGANYQGMQRNPGAITIEGELEQALYRAGAITKDNFGIPKKIDWMRAARTDKGVSAIGQVVSGQFIIEPEGFVERVNTFLPKDIVVLGYKRVIASFNAKRLCDKRRYEYIIPTYSFDPSQHLDRDTANAVMAEGNETSEGDDTSNKAKDGVETVVDGEGNSDGPSPVEGRQARSQKVKKKPRNGNLADPIKVKEEAENGEGISTKVNEETTALEGQKSEAEAEIEPYKFDEAELIRLNRILARYKGTHNYHNFTARTQAEDPSANRYIISFEADDVVTVDGIEFVRLHVVGQSFMLHQIRKMVGLAVAIMRGAAPVSVMDFALRKDTKFNVPMAPELGLFLEECYYSSYNQKFKSSHEELSLNDWSDAVSKFKKSVIYPHIASTETRDKVFPMWLHGINDRHFPDFVAAREGTYKPGNRTAEKAE
ncbi:hypothetical protein R1sor_000530 [Riccia sorocarpa]|uniref:Pseudouridine synthase I TruA alpha/beta domain-containing protein n=1 Tax=Riccia sorocarpa TaxID=122646 RepID=A0ABD3GU71_9MARC